MYNAVKKKTFILLHPEVGDSKWDKIINTFIIILIVLNVIAVMLETIPSILIPNRKFFHYFDLVSVIIFTIEYILRIWSCTHHKRYKHPVYGRIRYIFSFEALIDVLAILPFYMHRVIGFDLRVLRILRLLRFLRLFRLTAYMKSAKVVVNVFRSKLNELILSLVLVLFLIIIASCLIYFAEHLVQPEVFSSIPATMWWAFITLTTVGYGDMIPVTIIGKILTSVVTLAGVGLFALPAGIITAGFLEEMRKVRKPKQFTCPHCGEKTPADSIK